MRPNLAVVKPQDNERFGVYVNGELIEGGFFSIGAAYDCAWEHNSRLPLPPPPQNNS